MVSGTNTSGYLDLLLRAVYTRLDLRGKNTLVGRRRFSVVLGLQSFGGQADHQDGNDECPLIRFKNIDQHIADKQQLDQHSQRGVDGSWRARGPAKHYSYDEDRAYRLFEAALRIRCLTNSSGRSRLATITDRGVSMHDTAMEIGKRFFDTYAKNRSNLIIVDVGSQDVNGSLRSVAPPNNEYIGLDFVEGEGVDVVITDPYSLPLEDNSIDIVVCSSCFEHSEFFWLLFNDIQRLLKPSGLFYLNVPSNGLFHRYPVDCWRFYPDSGVALQNWARRNGLKTTLLESFTGTQKMDRWNDFIAVFVKDPSFISNYTDRIQTTYSDYTNGFTFETNKFTNAVATQEDQRLSLGKCVRSLSYWAYSHLPGFIKQRMRAIYRSTKPN